MNLKIKKEIIMEFLYTCYVDGEEINSNDINELPGIFELCSPDDETPALINRKLGFSLWCKKGWIWHRENGPAAMFVDGTKVYWYNHRQFRTIQDFLKHHPNQDEAFQKEMLERWR
jgi:hypothetical protein